MSSSKRGLLRRVPSVKKVDRRGNHFSQKNDSAAVPHRSTFVRRHMVARYAPFTTTGMLPSVLLGTKQPVQDGFSDKKIDYQY